MIVRCRRDFDLPARSLDYTVRPKIDTLNANTDRATINLSNVEIPVRIEGPWEKPNFSVAGQEQILEAMKEIGKNLKSKDVEEALKGLLGGGDGQQKVKPRDILEKLAVADRTQAAVEAFRRGLI